jgi:hypothetical protein
LKRWSRAAGESAIFDHRQADYVARARAVPPRFQKYNSYGPANALTTFEAFKIYGGQIHAVEAFIDIMRENTPSGWPNYEVKKPK